jgi:hypothetical protein
MASPSDSRTNRVAGPDSVLAPPASRLTTDPVQRWAAVIVDGHDQFPIELPPPDRDRFLAAVRRRRRDRLVQHIAHAIALALRGAARRFLS